MADRAATNSRKRDKPGRKRRVAGWLLLVIGVLITGVWGASGWWAVSYWGTEWSFGANGGIVFHAWSESAYKPMMGWRAARSQSKWSWVLSDTDPTVDKRNTNINLWILAYEDNTPTNGNLGSRGVVFVLWPFALASLLGSGWLLWSGRRVRRRAMTGMCLKCGYDLRGLATGSLCPECGGGGGGAAVTAR